MQGIYVIQSKDGHIYIGSSHKIKARFSDHRNRLRHNKHKNPHLQNYYNKHGSNSLTFVLVEQVHNTEKLTDVEQLYITNMFKVFDRKYIFNVAEDTVAPMRGKKMLPEWIEKWRLKHIGRPKAKVSVDRMAYTLAKGRTYKLKSPDGTVYDNIINLTEFSRQHNLEHTLLACVTRGTRKRHKGWTCLEVYYNKVIA